MMALLLVLVVLKENSLDTRVPVLPLNSVILAFGDSLTYGKGAPKESYPIKLQTLLGMHVINAGISGETSANGLKRLPSLLQIYHPSLVILCHGGNDLIQKKSKEVLQNNLQKMVKLIKKSEAEVLLVGVPNFKRFRFSTEPLYEVIAKEEKILYEGDVLTKIENTTSLKSDRIHPNAKGYTLMAERFANLLEERGLVQRH